MNRVFMKLRRRSMGSRTGILMLAAVMVTAVSGTAGARYYDPALARFLSPDSVEGPNRYAYVGNNPVNMIDPSGHERVSADLFGMQYSYENNVSGPQGFFDVNYAMKMTELYMPIGGEASIVKGTAPKILQLMPRSFAESHLAQVRSLFLKYSRNPRTAGELIEEIGSEFPLIQELNIDLKYAPKAGEVTAYSYGNTRSIIIGDEGMGSVPEIRSGIARGVSIIQDNLRGVETSMVGRLAGGLEKKKGPLANIKVLRGYEAGLLEVIPDAVHNFNREAVETARRLLVGHHRTLKTLKTDLRRYSLTYEPRVEELMNNEVVSKIRRALDEVVRSKK